MKLYHYTNMESLAGILREGADPGREVCLWCTDSRYMNDYTELKMGEKFLDDHLWSRGLPDWLEQLREPCRSFKTRDYYIASLSAQRDFLPMWGMYGRDGSGVAIEFESESLGLPQKELLIQCVYNNTPLLEEIERLLALAVADGEAEGMKEKVASFVVRCLCGVKHKAYRYEDEYRLVATTHDTPKTRFSPEGGYIPYFERFLPKKSISRIIIGPNQNKAEAQRRLERYLRFRGFGEIGVSTSDVPYKYLP